MKKLGKTILIIEDEKPLLELLSSKLQFEGFDTTLADNGKDALQIALEKHPDLILLDIIIPQMDGITMLKQLRKDEWGQSVPVIVLTNLSSGETVVAAEESGVRDFLTKTDWKVSELVDKIKNALNIRTEDELAV
ncbi:MAG: two component transcriptional regulator winged helix family [candidate division WWE3 bacterium GW2011_GWC1_41_7]|uniref:Phosphate regulon transcriptional regulatory protein PhoB (SphR) n=4 Tax=Katanobacteria TaxID=422282 RepID=A0A0G0ZKZ2_UNCKA|nr:MAG: Phosphate regulon transcriptional regulatory protein PhoB (SphR) [candidate division WWE3 bacterium GW2011_GWB1_41_6]KKS19824.1 MAG: two component transcriptional regulator winged helix family [candidate division WWE3 bacterium GW2011_GWC1_41_7]KKS22716.1 MAG: Phosphate regulon transcriptional regulatory protein PhoB (SphR) [candidate division WWE3 bacterium GW2011_GWA1_41_8]OGC57725.1 MAG: hypothetical protein A2976_02185 [candidate division WWE3 bacterium RIFCSPLOWO2_01_FULL_41_9]